jgi:hypothetical protein
LTDCRGETPGFLIMTIDTNKIRRSLLKLSRKYDDKFVEKLSEDVMAVCDAYDESNSLQAIIKAGQGSIDHSFEVLDALRKSL